MTTKIELINKLRSQNNKTTLIAVEEMRVRGWLSDGTMSGIALCRTQLQNADLMDADLSSVDFHQARLDWADLSLTNLVSAKAVRANLTGADFSQADIYDADFYKATLQGARNLTDEQLAQVSRLAGAIMPDGKYYNGRFNLEADLNLAKLSNVDVNNPLAMAKFYGVTEMEYMEGQGLFQRFSEKPIEVEMTQKVAA